MSLGTLGAAGAVTAALATGWIGTTLLIIAILVPAAVICWTVADSERPQRLALLLTVWRRSTNTTSLSTTPASGHHEANKPVLNTDGQNSPTEDTLA